MSQNHFSIYEERWKPDLVLHPIKNGRYWVSITAFQGAQWFPSLPKYPKGYTVVKRIEFERVVHIYEEAYALQLISVAVQPIKQS